MAEARQAVLRSGIEHWDILLRCAGVTQTPGLYVTITCILSGGVLLGVVFGGHVSGIVAGVMLLVAVYFYFLLRGDRRQTHMFNPFTERLVTMGRPITLGHCMAAGFQAGSAINHQTPGRG